MNSKAKELEAALYSLDWHQFESNSSRKSLVLMLVRVQRPIVINILAIFNINIEFFVVVSSHSVAHEQNLKQLFVDCQHFLQHLQFHVKLAKDQVEISRKLKS